MLVRINSNTSGDMIMFAEHLRLLFDIIGKECSLSIICGKTAVSPMKRCQTKKATAW